jgi:CTP:molybdopterin cytidylyltransferase MocA
MAAEDVALVVLAAGAGTRFLEVVHALDAAGVGASDVHRREVTLDDVFLALTTRRRAVAT